MSEPRVLTAEEAESAAPVVTLPPGDAQREEKKKLLAQLDEAREKLMADIGIEAIDPSKLRHVDNEIGRFADKERHFDGSEVEGALPDFVYKWEEAAGARDQSGMAVFERKAEGWVVVDSHMPEERRRLAADGTRRWGTTILMRIPRARAEELDVLDRRRRIARSEGVSVAILEAAEKAGINVYDQGDPHTPAHIRAAFGAAQIAGAQAARATMVSNMRQAGRAGAKRVLASELAEKRLTTAIREGTVPGLPVGS